MDLKIQAVFLCTLVHMSSWSRHLNYCFSSLAAISNPKAPKEPAKNFSFDYSYWSHTTVRFEHCSIIQCNESGKDLISSVLNELISFGNSQKTPTSHLRTGFIMTSEKRCCNTLSRATTSASLLMDRRERANRILWWGSRRRARKESFPWFVPWCIDLNSLRFNNWIFKSQYVCLSPFHILIATANHLPYLFLSSVKIYLRRSMRRPTKKVFPTQLRWESGFGVCNPCC